MLPLAPSLREHEVAAPHGTEGGWIRARGTWVFHSGGPTAHPLCEQNGMLSLGCSLGCFPFSL